MEIKLTKEQDDIYNKIINDLEEVRNGDIFAEHSWISLKGPAGCSTKGNNVDINISNKLYTPKEICTKLDINKKEFTYLKKKGSFKRPGKKILYTLDFNLNHLKIFHSKNSYRNAMCMSRDSHYKNKFLHLNYWLGFKDIEDAVKIVKRTRKYKRFFEENLIPLNSNTGFIVNPKNILLIQKDIIENDKFILHSSKVTKQYWIIRGYSEVDSIKLAKESQNGRQCITNLFWLNRGYTIEEAKRKVSKIQKNNYLKKETKYTKKELRKFTSTCIEYWLNKGYSTDESMSKLKQRQNTFSLDICIEKHGKEKGIEIFNKRQLKWQNTLNSKPQEEIDSINRRKSSGIGCIPAEQRNIKGILYYIRFYNEDIEFWKIGITSKDINKRFGKELVFENKTKLKREVLWIKEDTILNCYIKEQEILYKNDKFRISIDYNGFNSTECFEKDVLCK